MSVLFVEYPKCSTCKKAKKWLVEHNIAFFDRHIVEDNPSKEELMAWAAKSGLPLKRIQRKRLGKCPGVNGIWVCGLHPNPVEKMGRIEKRTAFQENCGFLFEYSSV